MSKERLIQELSFQRVLAGGLVAGTVGAIAANAVAQMIEAVTGLHFVELNPVTITLASIVTNLLGAWVYFMLLRHTERPQLIFIISALVLATLDTLNVTIVPPHDGFGVIADPLHYIVALAAVVIIPIRVKEKQRRGVI